jgi:peptidoglycan/LPS O-acetylase OafA/YrhL
VSKQSLYIPSLDGLRAVSFGIVFLAHAGLERVVPGGFGVTVFFFLSGYLITTLMRVEHAETGTVSLKNFYLRRVLRILPPFYIVLFTASGLAALGLIRGGVDPRAFMAQALHYANVFLVLEGSGGFAPGTTVYWSLAVEEHFYFLFPMLFLGLAGLKLARTSQALVLALLCLVVLVWRAFLVYVVGVSEDRTYVATDTRFDSILYGCALAVGSNPALDEPVGSERLWKLVLFPLGIAGLLVSFLFRDEGFRETARYSLQGLSLVPVFVCAVRYPAWGPMRLLNLKPVAFLGVLSYSLYLVHHVALYGVAQWFEGFPAVVRGAIAFVLSLGVSLALYRWVEKPCARLRKRFARSAAQPAPALG